MRVAEVVAGASAAVSAMEAAAARECSAKGHVAEAWKSFVASFYGRLIPTVRERFGVSEDEARAFCAARRAEVVGAGSWPAESVALHRLAVSSLGGSMASEIVSIPEGTLREWSAAAQSVTAEQLAAFDAAQLIPARRAVGNVAVVTVRGYVSQRPSPFAAIFGGVSTEALAREVEALMADSSVGAVVLDVDSPGGSVSGVPEAAERIRSARGAKPLVALTNTTNASAAYWLSSQCDAVYTTASGITGSIGVYTMHVDASAAYEQMGFKVRIIKYGARKADGNPFEPLSKEAEDALARDVAYFGRRFEGDVAKGRRISVERVRSDFGQGGTMTADDAVSSGLVDGVETLDGLISKLARGWRPEERAKAEEPAPVVEAAAEPEPAPFDLREIDWQAEAWGVANS